MRIPEIVLSHLSSKATDYGYKFKNLYRNLYNPHFFLKAYGKIAHNPGNMTPGSDDKTIDGMSLERIEKIINSLRDESYKPNPAKRKYINKKNDPTKKRPLGIPSFDDKLVQEVCRMILESIFEPAYKDTSHGFRPNRSCHTAIEHIDKNFNGSKWFIEGDIKGFFDNIDHHILVNLIRKRVEDEKFIRLIWKFLKAGYLEDWIYHKTYSGTPQGGIISPILANVYLNELDRYIEEYQTCFNKGKRRKASREYNRLTSEKRTRIARLKRINDKDSDLRKNQIKLIKETTQNLRKVPSQESFDENYKKIVYVRYADDFLIGVIGSKKDAIQIKTDIKNFLEEKLRLELSEQKTLITHASKDAKFLGFGIRVRNQNESITTNAKGIKKRSSNGRMNISVPSGVIRDKLLELKAIKINPDGAYNSIHRKRLLSLTPLEIINIYNAEIRGLYNYYKYATNVSSHLHNFHHMMEYSLYKTLGAKFKKSIKKIIERFSVNGRFGIEYNTKEGKRIAFLIEKSYPFDKQSVRKKTDIDNYPNTFTFTARTSLEERLMAGECEWCGASNVPLEIHHVRKLKDLKGKKKWEINMIARRRKTLALCIPCHVNLHAGRLD